MDDFLQWIAQYWVSWACALIAGGVVFFAKRYISMEKISYINNGVDIESFDLNTKCYFFKDEDLDNTKTHKVIYTGSIRKANRSIMILPKVATELTKQGRTDIQLLIYGKGDFVDGFVEECKKREIKNLIFKGFVKRIEIPYILSKADVTILNCNSTAIGKYGSCQNKLFEYLASGNPILSGEDDKYSIVFNRKCGIII